MAVGLENTSKIYLLGNFKIEPINLTSDFSEKVKTHFIFLTNFMFNLDFGESKTFTLIRGKPSRKIMHVWHLAQLLAMMKDKTGKYVHTGEVI